MRVQPALTVLLLSIGLLGCPPDEPKDDTEQPEETAPPVDTQDTAPSLDGACEELGLPMVEFQQANESKDLYATAADFTVTTRDGSEWTLSEHWTGCDSYLLVQDNPSQAAGWPTGLWERDVAALFDALPRNTQLLFMSTGTSTEAINESLDAMQVELDGVLASMSEEDRAWWTPRVVMVSQRAQIISGWVGQIMSNPGWGVGIDRAQRIRYIGSYADPTRYHNSYGWFEPNISMVANEAAYYNFEAEREAALEATAALVVPVFETERVAGNLYKTVELPDAGTIAAYDTVEIDLYMGCEGSGEYGDCPAWDYMAYLFMCDMPDDGGNPWADTPCQPAVDEVMGLCSEDGVATKTACRAAEDCGSEKGVVYSCDGYEAAIAADTLEGACASPLGAATSGSYTCNEEGTGFGDLDCASCGHELGRWITTYHREGRWVHDVSALMPMLAEGGERELRFATNGPYELDMSLRFSDSGKATKPAELVHLYSGCDLTGDCNANYTEPATVEIPADAAKVTLATVITGHGMSSPGNCAEFCDMDHIFTVNDATGDTVVVDFPGAGSTYGCMEAVGTEGTVPNQYGTWWYGRGGWCPGKDVPVQEHDITSLVTPGEEASIAYRVERNGADYQATSSWAHTVVNAWLVIER
jgi:hypothetical protein